MEKKTIYDDTYPLDDRFPVHMNRLWMKKYHGTDEHWHWHDFYEISYICSGTANEMLETTDENVVEIAAECGFNSTANFYRTYRKYYQKAPRQKVSAIGSYDSTAG